MCVSKLCVCKGVCEQVVCEDGYRHACHAKLPRETLDKLCVSKLSVSKLCVCKLCVSKLYVIKLCVNKLCARATRANPVP